MKLLLAIIVSVIIGNASLAQAPAPKQTSPVDQLREAIKILESDPPELSFGIHNPAFVKRLEKLNAEIMEVQKLAMAVELIQRAIAQIETAEKQKVRVVPTLPTP